MVAWNKGKYINRLYQHQWTSFASNEFKKYKMTEGDTNKLIAEVISPIINKVHVFSEAEMCKALDNFFAKFKPSTTITTPITTPISTGRQPVKKALLVGINKYDPKLNADLNGCVNDVENIRDILVSIYKFNPDNIRVLTDYRATKAAILERLTWLIDGCIPGDEMIFQFSGHGSQIRDRDGDELEDGLDEILVPTNMDWNDPLKDDDLAATFKKVPVGAYLTMIADACHSGSISREILPPGCGCEEAKKYNKPRYLEPPFDIRSRGMVDKYLKVRQIGADPVHRGIEQNHVLISGCMDKQTSADAHIGGKYQGAMTWALTDAIRKNPNITFKEAHAQVINTLKSNNYEQIPQLSGNQNLVDRKVFGGK